jgi:hypothetical protein
MNPKSIKLENVRIDGGTQTRIEINQDVVEDYSQAVLDGAKFPPVDIFYDGTSYWLADGFHRYHGHRRAEVLDILATVHLGTLDDALKFALGANRANGLRRSNEDKRNCVTIALAKWPEWSDRRIAEVCGVGNAMVGDTRRRCLNQTPPTTTPKKPKTRKGKDGKEYPAPKPKLVETADEQDASPESPKRIPMPKIDQGMRLWVLAKAHLDKIIKQDVSREAALNEAMEYCRNRINNKL